MVDNQATTTYTATTEGNETVNITMNGDVLSKLDFVVGTSVAGKIFVSDATGNDTTGDGSRFKPYKTISQAISKASSGNTIYVYAGNYSEYKSISKDLTIIGLGDVRIKSDSSYYPYVFSIGGSYTVNFINLTFADTKYESSSGYSTSPGVIYTGSSSYYNPTLNIVDCNFINNYAPTGVIGGEYMNLNLTRCNFNNNTGTGSSAYYNYGLIFFGSGGSLNITYCNFVNNTAKNDYLIYLYK